MLGFTFLLCCAAHSGPIFHVVSYAMYCGLGSMAAVSVYSVEGLAGLGGRCRLGLLADRFGAKRVLITALAVQAVAIAAYLKVNELDEFYALAVIFGVAYGGGMPLYASLARDYFGQHIMGTVFGAATMLSSLGMAIGPVAGGWVFDTFDNYAWLYIASAAVAVGAVLLALLFPKPGAHGRGRSQRPSFGTICCATLRCSDAGVYRTQLHSDVRPHRTRRCAASCWADSSPGLADWIYPTVKTVMAGGSWMRPWKGVAGGLLGQAARDGGIGMVVLGTALHFFICIVAAAMLYFVVSRVKWLPRNWMLLGRHPWHRGSADHELRHPAALGHRPRHLSARAAAHPRVLAHRAGGPADGVLRLARA